MNSAGVRGRGIRAQEADRIAELLRTRPIFEVHKLTGLKFSTLAKLAEAIRDD